MATFRVGARRYSPDEAFEVVAGYAFGMVDLGWRRRRSHVGAEPRQARRARWAYRAYDCIPPAPGPELTGVDLLVADGLNGQMRAHTIAGLLAVAGDVSESLRRIPNDTRFWELEESQVRRPGPEGSTLWHVHRAWSLLMGTPFVGIAVCHKTLHHKRPGRRRIRRARAALRDPHRRHRWSRPDPSAAPRHPGVVRRHRHDR